MFKTCEKCQKKFPNSITLDGKRVFYNKRKLCLECSPYGIRISNQVINGFKKCLHCNKDFPATKQYFVSKNSKTGQLVSRCKPCWSKYINKKQRDLKQKCVDYLGGKCVICNYYKYCGALDFHHINPNNKEFELSCSGITSFKRAKSELDKCILVCSRCHREIHGGLHSKYLISPPVRNRT